MKTKVTNANKTMMAALISVVAVAAAVALPQACHLLGRWLGVQSALGEMLLPMHLPVMLAGFFGGPVAGLVAGLTSPVISFGLTGMPASLMVPFMMIELATYGLVAALLRKNSLPAVVKVLAVQVAGRAVRALALVVAAYGLGMTTPPMAVIWTSISAGAVGILLQLALIPALLRVVKK